MSEAQETIPLKYQRRKTRLRPVFPKIDWMIMPNALAYVMSWYGLLIGKFPVQIMCMTLGMAVMFAAGLSRITLVELKTEDFLPTDSPSTEERSQTVMFDFSERESPSDFATIMRPTIPPKTPSSMYRTTTKPRTSNFTTSIRNTSLLATTLPSNKTNPLDDLIQLPMPTFKVRRKRDQSGLMGPDGTSQNCRVSAMLIVAKKNTSDPNGKSYNLFEKAMLREIEALENMIYDMAVTVRTTSGMGGTYHYEDRDEPGSGVCTKQPTGECGGFTLRVMKSLFRSPDGRDPINLLFSKIPGVGLTWPHYLSYDLSAFFGRVETVNDKPNGMVRHLGAMREVFCINEYYWDYFMRAIRVWERWEQKFDETVRKYHSKYFDVFWMSESQKQAEQNTLVFLMLPKLVCTFVALMLWCSVGALMGDAVQSKPWCGFIGVLSTLIACAAGFGIQLWMDPKFQVILMAVPLLTLAIGLDDMFILLEAWGTTNPKLPIEERMMLAMNTGGTSIVITFFINLLDFVVGNFTPFPVIQMLSEYAIATMVLDFFFQMTVFAPCVVLFGRDEEKNKHACCCCVTLHGREKSMKSRSPCFLICCAGGYADQVFKNEKEKEKQAVQMEKEEENDSALVEFVVKVISSLPFRIIALFLFAGYLAGSIWSIMQMEVGLKAERVYRESSNLYAYFQHHRQLFTGYGKEVNVVVMNEIDYASPAVRQKLIDMVDKIEGSGFFWSDSETNFWLRDFLGWANDNGISLTTLKNNSDVLNEIRRYPGGFLDSTNPRNYELYGSSDKYGRAIRMSTDGTRILRSRFKFRAKDMTGPQRQMAMMQTVRNILKPYKPEIVMYAYMDEFQLYDQFLTAIPTTLYYCGITLAVTVGVAIFMIPHPACLFWVAVFVATVLLGIVALMRGWDVDLDSVSLINLLIAISFCSDLIAHPIYIFMISPADNKDGTKMTGRKARVEKAKATVKEVSEAAIPACIGTTLSVLAMSNSDAYIFIAFFRIMFLSVVLSIAHAIIFVPAFLSFIGPSDSRLQIAVKSTDKEKEEEDAAAKSDVPAIREEDYEESSTPSSSGSKHSRSLAQIVHRSSERQGSSGSSQQKIVRRRIKPATIAKTSSSETISSSVAPFVTQRRLTGHLFRGMRGGLSGLNETPITPNVNENSVGRNLVQRKLPPTIARMSNATPPPIPPKQNDTLSNKRLAEVKEELRRHSVEMREQERKQRVREKINPPSKKQPATRHPPLIADMQQASPKSPLRSDATVAAKFFPRDTGGFMSERLRKWAPPLAVSSKTATKNTQVSFTTTRPPTLKPALPAQVKLVPLIATSSSGNGHSSNTNGSSGRTAPILTSRTGALMLPARNRFNM